MTRLGYTTYLRIKRKKIEILKGFFSGTPCTYLLDLSALTVFTHFPFFVFFFKVFYYYQYHFYNIGKRTLTFVYPKPTKNHIIPVLGSLGIAPTRNCTHFLKIIFLVAGSGFYSYYIHPGNKSEKERDIVRKKVKFYAYKKIYKKYLKI